MRKLDHEVVPKVGVEWLEGTCRPAREGSGVHKPLSMHYAFQLACLSYLSQGWRCVRTADVHDGGHQQSWNHLERWAERMAHVCENSPTVQSPDLSAPHTLREITVLFCVTTCTTADELSCRCRAVRRLPMSFSCRFFGQPTSRRRAQSEAGSSCHALCSTLRSCAGRPRSASFLAAQRRHRILLQHCRQQHR